jgi:LysR family transcriptional regulator, regulator for bpeEF and oprC
MDRLDALRVFCTVVEQGGFSRAADRLGISTASVTKQVSSLERHFHVRLLNRTTRNVSLTDDGRQCYEQALQLLGEMRDLEDMLRESESTATGVLHIDMSTVISRLYIAPALPAFLKNHPGMRIKATVSDRNIAMTEEGVDVLIRIGELPDSNFIARTLCRTQYLCCASPDYLARHGVPETPEDLARFDCLNYLKLHSGLPRAWQFLRDGQAFSYLPPARLAFNHPESLMDAARSGGGIIQLLSVSVLPAIRAGELVPVLQHTAAPGPPVSAMYQQRALHTAKIKAFVDFAQDLFTG